MDPNGMRLCEPSLSLDENWKRIYEGAFPEGEREPTERLSKLIAEGKMLYHRTLNEQGELLCFTMVSLAQRFSFLAYMATDPQKRSGGVGTKHLSRLIEVLKTQFPNHSGLFLEIEATNPRNEPLSEEELRTRVRRRTFYERLGGRTICDQGVYLTPSYSEPGVIWEGELMVVEFGERVCRRQLASVIQTIYREFYCLPDDNPMVRKVLRNFADCASGCNQHSRWDEVCEWVARLLTSLRLLLVRAKKRFLGA